MAFFTRPQSASAAVKIVAPNAVSDDPIKTSPKKGKAVRLITPHLGRHLCPRLYRLYATTM
jgi:hypothetical protein